MSERWTAPHQNAEQAYCSDTRTLTAAERAQRAMARVAEEAKPYVPSSLLDPEIASVWEWGHAG